MRQLLVCGLVAACGLLGQANRDLRYEVEPGKRLALIVGNEAYPKWPLRNPANDARSVAQALAELGFQNEVLLNANLRALEKSVDQFVSRIRPGDVALFYYAGHGIQLQSENYLVPTDFDAKDEADAKYVSYSASRLQERIDTAGARLSIIILDACRNNPFRASRSTGGGLAAMSTGKGTLIALATSPGKTADDNVNGSNGLFTAHLVEALREPGLSLDQVFNRVRERVYKDSAERQLPWTVSSVIGEFQFRKAGAATGVVTNPLQKKEGSLLSAIRQTVPEPAPVAPAIVPAPAPVDLVSQAATLYNSQQFDQFEQVARQALAAGNELTFLLGHHHTLTGIHASTLKLSRAGLSFEPMANANVCNQKAFQSALATIESAKPARSDRGEVFFNLRIRDAQNKIRNFNFADADSKVDTTQGLPLVVSPIKSQRAMQAVANVILAAAALK